MFRSRGLHQTAVLCFLQKHQNNIRSFLRLLIDDIMKGFNSN